MFVVIVVIRLVSFDKILLFFEKLALMASTSNLLAVFKLKTWYLVIDKKHSTTVEYSKVFKLTDTFL